MLGTAAYLAPEQAAGEQAGPAADLYALGVVAYQLLSGRLPYEAQSLTELALKQQREVPPRLDELNPEVSPQLAMAVDRALALDPRQRPASADELRQPAGRRRARHRPRRPTRRRAAPPGPRRAPPASSDSTARAPPASPARRSSSASRGRPRDAAPGAGHLRDRRRPWTARRAGAAGRKRFFGIALVLLLLAAGGAAAVVATSNSDQAVKLRRVVYDDVQQGVDAVKQLVQDNTQ